MFDVSICIGTFNKPQRLAKALESIYAQDPKLRYEVIIGNDGDDWGIAEFCPMAQVIQCRPAGGPYRNPSHARNAAMKRAQAEILILQSDDVVHVTYDAIAKLADCPRGTMQLATVFNRRQDGALDARPLTGAANQRPLFFLGSVRREDISAIGGNDEEFIHIGYEDGWLADCLVNGRGLMPVYRDDVVGHHIDHPRPDPRTSGYFQMRDLYARKRHRAAKTGVWCASGGPWPYDRRDDAQDIDCDTPLEP